MTKKIDKYTQKSGTFKDSAGVPVMRSDRNNSGSEEISAGIPKMRPASNSSSQSGNNDQGSNSGNSEKNK